MRLHERTDPPDDAPLVDAREACRLAGGVCEKSLKRHAPAGCRVRIGAAVRYRRKELVAWLEAGCPRQNYSNGGAS